MNRHFSKENRQMANRHMKKCSTSLFTRAIDIKTTMRYHLPPVRMAKINKSINDRCWRQWGKKELSYIVDGNASWCSHSGKQYGGSSKKLKIELPYNTAIALLSLYRKGTNVLIQGAPPPQCL